MTLPALQDSLGLAFSIGLLVAVPMIAVFAYHRSGGRWEVPVLVALLCLPSLYLVTTQTGVVADAYVRFTRPFAAPLATLATAYALMRCLRFRSNESRLRRGLRDTSTTLLTLCLGLAVAGVEIGRPLDRMAVFALVDRSRSIDLVMDAESRVEAELQVAELGMQKGDRFGVLAFGAGAVVEVPLRTREQRPTPQTVSIGRDATDIEQALRRGLMELPSDARGKLVLLSDGVATRGAAKHAVASAVAAGVPVDVVPLEQTSMPNVRVVSLGAPSSVSEGETFNLRAVIESSAATDLEVRVSMDGQLLLSQDIRVDPGQDVLDLRQRADGAGLRRYELQITSRDSKHDRLADDNRRSSFVRVRGPSAALVLSQNVAKARPLKEALESAEIRVTTADAYGIPSDVSEFGQYDLVVLMDLPARLLTPTQLNAIEAYVRHLGGGLLLMGSDQSMGPGGYGKTPVEAVSPVSFDLKQDRRRASLAEVIAIDFSGSMAADVNGNTKLELANEAAVRSASLLAAADHLGVMHVDTQVHWTRRLERLDDKETANRAIRSVGPGGGGIYVDITLREAYGALSNAKTNLKHVLLFADGADAEMMDLSPSLARDALGRGITTSVVALGDGNDVPKLEHLSRVGSGRFYLIKDAERLPAVFAQETILAARSALNEVDFVPKLRSSGGALRGVDFSNAPPLHGYVVTIPKPRSQVLLDGPERDPLLSIWSVGVGKAAAFTSDFSTRWGKHWTAWPEGSQLFAQLGRSLARAHDDSKIRLRAEASGGELSVVADVVDDKGALDSYREFAVHVAGPGGYLETVPLDAEGPGRYGAELALERPGAYMVSAVELTSGKLVASAGAELSTSDELRPTGTNLGALARIAREGGGELRDTLAGIFEQRLGLRFAYSDVSSTLLWSSAILLVVMVAFRRLSLPDWVLGWLKRPKPPGGSKPPRDITSQSLSRVLFTKRAKKKTLQRGEHSLQPSSPPASPKRDDARTVTRAPVPRATPRSSRSPEAGRKLTSAELLLAKRRSRR